METERPVESRSKEGSQVKGMTPAKNSLADSKAIKSENPKTPSKTHDVSSEAISTPDKVEDQKLAEYIEEREREFHVGNRSLNAPGPMTFDKKYMPFAGGFAHMIDGAIVYRSTKLEYINPTGAVSDDVSYYYTLDSGRIPPAAVAADPETAEEFVRNTSTAAHGGVWNRLMKPIE